MKRTITPRIGLRLALERVKRETRKPLYLLAAEAGISETRLSKVLSGTAEPREEERRRLAEIVGVEDASLFADA